MRETSQSLVERVGRRLLLGLEVVEEDGALLGLLTPVLDDDAGAVDDLAGVALAVNLACGFHQCQQAILSDGPVYQSRAEQSIA